MFSDRRHFRRVKCNGGLSGRSLLPLRGGERDDVDPTIGADDREPAIRERDICWCGLQHLACRLLALADNRVGGEQDDLALGVQATRTTCPATNRYRVRVTLADADLFSVDAEPL